MRPPVTEYPASPKPEMKPWIAAIHAYAPGQSRSAEGRPLIKLSANENPLGTSPAALEALAAAAVPSLYPDPDSTELRAALAELHGIDPVRIVCGTGSDELLNLAAQAFAGPGDEVLYVRYGFAVYDIAARRCGATVVVAPDKDYGTDVNSLLACVTERTRVMFVANPNNPTGTYLPPAELARLHASLPGRVLLVLDQAYAEYLALEDDNRTERTRFAAAIEALGNHGLRAVPSEANFVLVLFEGKLTAEAALEGLAEAGYAVRHLPGQGLPQALRITIGTREQMDAVAAALREMTEAAR